MPAASPSHDTAWERYQAPYRSACLLYSDDIVDLFGMFGKLTNVRDAAGQFVWHQIDRETKQILRGDLRDFIRMKSSLALEFSRLMQTHDLLKEFAGLRSKRLRRVDLSYGDREPTSLAQLLRNRLVVEYAFPEMINPLPNYLVVLTGCVANFPLSWRKDDGQGLDAVQTSLGSLARRCEFEDPPLKRKVHLRMAVSLGAKICWTTKCATVNAYRKASRQRRFLDDGSVVLDELPGPVKILDKLRPEELAALRRRLKQALARLNAIERYVLLKTDVAKWSSKLVAAGLNQYLIPRLRRSGLSAVDIGRQLNRKRLPQDEAEFSDWEKLTLTAADVRRTHGGIRASLRNLMGEQFFVSYMGYLARKRRD